MAKLTLSEAARACGVARTTIQRAVKTGRLSLDAEHLVDTAELLRVGYQVDAAVLHAAAPQSPRQTPQNAAPPYSTPQRSDAASQELQLVRQERDLLQQERNRLAQQVDVLLTLHQTTQQQPTQAQQMLYEMQHRYDRLLEAPRPAPAPPMPVSGPLPRPDAAPSPQDPVLAQILRWRQEGMSLRAIAAKLNADGVPTRSGQGQWYQSNLSRMLKRVAPR
jgi:transcriptional regulator with XRE-family HTH domain